MPKTSAPSAARTEIVVAVVEDDPLIRQGLTELLDGQGWVVEDFATGEELLAAIRPGAFQCLLLDARLPGISGLDVMARLRADGVRLPTLVITGASDIRTAVAAMKAGALDFIQKPVLGPELIAAVTRAVAPTGDQSGAADARRDAAALRIGALTPRQQEVMHRVLAGQANKVIAAELDISQRTVENHRARIMRRTGSASLPELARLAQTAGGLVDSEPSPVAAAAAALSPLAPLDDDQFRRFFDAVPMAILISAIGAPERIVYANPAFETLSGQTLAEIEGQPWSSLAGVDAAAPERALGAAIADAGEGASDWLGAFVLPRGGDAGATADVYVSLILNDADAPAFRMAALVAVADERADDRAAERTELEKAIRDKDLMILEIQHRVKNNLQMITSLIRIEARTHAQQAGQAPLDRLEGRINAIQILYRLLSDVSATDQIDLGVYLSEIASAVMHAHAVEGIRLELKVDAYPVSVNVALPTGLAVNELLTNALKHAFVGRDGGTITLHSLTDDRGCRVLIADDGVGLPRGEVWPRRGSLGELIVRSLRQNAGAELTMDTAPGRGVRVTLGFSRAASSPEATG